MQQSQEPDRTDDEVPHASAKIADHSRLRRIVGQTFTSLAKRSFRNLWIGFLLQMGGMQMLMLSISYYIYEITAVSYTHLTLPTKA